MAAGVRSYRGVALSLVGALGLSLAAAVPAHATPITYNVTLTDSSDTNFSGTLTVTFSVAPAATFTDVHGTVTAMSILLNNGDTFNLTDSGVTFSFFGFSSFSPITIWDITFSDTKGSVSPNRIEFASTGTYIVYYNNDLSNSSGVFGAVSTANTTSSTVPEPTSLVLLGTGFAGVAGGYFRKRRAIV